MYKYWYFIVAPCFSCVRPSPSQHSEILSTISADHVLWDPTLLTRCTKEKFKTYKNYIIIYIKIDFKSMKWDKIILVRMEIYYYRMGIS